ncbi:hypothetical protein [Pseudomonas sp. CFBP13509]|uniref:hypothetical protein n=1 Tax=Pseudomonas sp. CFBP13509 TaxID=2184008 RepID=UPI0010C07686|nr:hypothetical protein [Pseudomonas sp. CFBP13509]TKJ78783.1 hypothetical protein PspCFBP13509_16085 [Pseudomonas sp. CFBP13509]
MSIDIDKSQADLVRRFVLSVTIPILHEIGHSAAVVATGTLFKIANRSFIITVRHLFDQVSDLTLLAYPENPLKGALRTFGDMKLYKPDDDKIDVAVIELHSQETIARLEARWQFLTLQNVASPSANPENGAVFVAGYPVALTGENNGWTHGSFLTAYTQRRPDVPTDLKEPYIEGLDLFFDYGREAQALDGQSVFTPDLEGVSGGSVWELVESQSIIWSAVDNVRVVGVQSSFRHSDFTRAKNWWAVAKVLEQIDERLASEVRARLDSNLS